MRKVALLVLVALCLFSGNTYAQKNKVTKVACVGNSITHGARIADRLKDAYPEQLSRMLGESYEVKNFGVSGRTLLSKGNAPYIKTGAYREALKFNPDVIFIKLGTNDSKPFNWEFNGDFKSDYLKLIQSFQELESNPTIYLCLAVPVFKSGMVINDEIVRDKINPLIKEIAKENNLKLVDLFTPFLGKGDLFPDHIHPNAEGAGVLAKIIYKELTGREGVLVQQPFPGKKSAWNGFDRYDFTFEGKSAVVVQPAKALKGKPWVWRARFFGWHTEMDRLLVSEGYHLVYLNTNNQFGSPNAVRTWDHLYKYLTNVHHFNPKVALEGVSRGGLFIYNFAKKYPERVSCIYAEAPVCDFKSWPGGFGFSEGSAKDWASLKTEYGFRTDEEAKAFSDNPVDNLEELAKAKVPVLHMISLTDSVVPPAENSLVLINKYIQLGGMATVIPCTNGRQSLHGHHFPIETPRLGADFIIYHTPKEAELLDPAAYHQVRGGLRNSLIKFQREKKGRVAFLGGSITYNGGWRDSICSYLQQRFPDTEFEFIAAGIPSMGSTPASFRMDRDVFKGQAVDLLFEEAAVNDAGNGRSDTEQIRAMEGIVRHALSLNPTTDVVVMHFVDPGKMKIYREGGIPRVIQNHEKVAAHYNLPAINLAREVTERIDAGEFTWKDDFKNLHPSPFGQSIYYRSMKSLLEEAWFGPVADDDKVMSHPIPEPLDPANYSQGALIDITEARIRGAWEIVENWRPTDGKGTRDNYTNVPMLIGEKTRGLVKLPFDGNTVGIAVAAGPDAGLIEFRIDGSPWQKLDLLSHGNRSLHLPRYYTLAAGLKNKRHRLKIRMLEQEDPNRAGNFCRIRYFYNNQPPQNFQ